MYELNFTAEQHKLIALKIGETKQHEKKTNKEKKKLQEKWKEQTLLKYGSLHKFRFPWSPLASLELSNIFVCMFEKKFWLSFVGENVFLIFCLLWDIVVVVIDHEFVCLPGHHHICVH